VVSVLTFAHRSLETHAEHVRWCRDAIAFDDHGRLVGLAASALEVVVAPGWADSGLQSLLARVAES
jgi:hypothetical protein